MNCPLDAVSLVPRRLESGVDAEVCPVCNGVWLEQAELDSLVQTHAHARVPEAPESVQAAFAMARQDLAPPGPCPICADTLARREYGYASQVLIDTCPRGHGIWLDAGELEALEGFFARQQASAPEPTPLRELWARVVAALRGDRPIG